MYASDVLTDSQRDLFVLIIFECVCTTICFLGILANLINMVVFVKQGFTNTVNISFLGLAVSDMGCLLTLLWLCICFNPLVLIASSTVWVPLDFMYLTGAWPHNISSRITSFITVFVTFERYLCITVPLKVKNIFSPARTTIAVVLIFVLNITTLLPEYATLYLDWHFFPETNKTLLALSFRTGMKRIEGLVYILNGASGVFSFVAVIVITTLLVVKLKETSQWRQEVTSGNDHRMVASRRDKKMVKMVALIAGVMIACYTPGIIVSSVTFVEPEFNLGKRYANSFTSMWSFGGMFQAINSSVNFVLYYLMSSNYRDTFQKLFNLHTPQ